MDDDYEILYIDCPLCIRGMVLSFGKMYTIIVNARLSFLERKRLIMREIDNINRRSVFSNKKETAYVEGKDAERQD